MCSIAEEHVIVSEDIVSGSEYSSIDLLCKKCLVEKPAIRLQKKHCYCRSCFLNMVTHKFRSTLGKTKLMKPQDKVLIAFLNNQNSMALLHLVKEGMEGTSHKKLRFDPVILFVDENICIQEQHEDKLAEDIESLKFIGFKCYVTKLSSIFDSDRLKLTEDYNVADNLTSNENDVKLRHLFDSISNNTFKIDFLRSLRYRLLFQAARTLNCNKIFTSECGTNLSINLLTNVSLGRGSQAPVDIAVCDKKMSDIYLIRPLREITAKEIAFYNVFNRIDARSHHFPFFTINSGPSLQQETESFVYQLQETFPSTVYTIFSIGDKLKDAQHSVQKNTCCWCFNAITSSENENHILDKNPSSKACANCKCGNKISKASFENFASVLCDSCRKIFIDMESIDNLPEAIFYEMRNQILTNDMKKQIEDFLL